MEDVAVLGGLERPFGIPVGCPDVPRDVSAATSFCGRVHVVPPRVVGFHDGHDGRAAGTRIGNGSR